MRRQTSIGTVSIGLLAILAACGSNQEEFREVRDGQRQVMAKLADLEKKVDQVASRPAAQQAPGQPDPNKVYTIPAGNSPFKGPANAPVMMVEFSDFQ